MHIPLSPIDQVFTGTGSYPLEFVFAYSRAIDPDRLAASLGQALALFPAVSSRLVHLGRGGFGLEPSPDGCVFEVVDAAVDFADVSARGSFLSPVETREGEPLARIRLSRTGASSVLGVSLSHAVVDGFSFFHFLSSWSRLFNGREAVPPSDRRELLAPRAVDAGPPLGPADALDRSGLYWGEPRPAIRRDALRWDRKVLARAELKALHERAQERCDVRLSHNDVVAAWLWRTYVPAWSEGAPDELARFVHCPVDLRRVLSSVPPTYFGCAVALAVADVERERLPDAPLGELALKVRRAVDAVDEARALGSLALLERLRRQEGDGVFEKCHVVHPRAGLLVTNLSRLPAREVEFDAGPPVAFDILTPAERCAVVLPARDGLDVRVCLPAAAVPGARAIDPCGPPRPA